MTPNEMAQPASMIVPGSELELALQGIEDTQLAVSLEIKQIQRDVPF